MEKKQMQFREELYLWDDRCCMKKRGWWRHERSYERKKSRSYDEARMRRRQIRVSKIKKPRNQNNVVLYSKEKKKDKWPSLGQRVIGLTTDLAESLRVESMPDRATDLTQISHRVMVRPIRPVGSVWVFKLWLMHQWEVNFPQRWKVWVSA